MDWISVGSMVGTALSVVIAYRALQRSMREAHGKRAQQEQNFLMENERRHAAHESDIKLIQQEMRSLASRIDERLATTNCQVDMTNQLLIQNNDLLRDLLREMLRPGGEK